MRAQNEGLLYSRSYGTVSVNSVSIGRAAYVFTNLLT